MQQRSNILWKLTTVLALAALAGCGGADRPTLYQIKGKVTVGGQPLADADIAFHPVDREKVVRSPMGRTNSNGEYVMGTYTNSDGAIAGEYKVTVAKVKVKSGVDPKSLTPGGPPGAAGPGGSSNAADYQKMMVNAQGGDSITEKSADIPEKYTKPDTTDLRAVVGPDSPPEINFDL